MLRCIVHLKGGPKRTRHAAVAVGHKVYSFGGHDMEIIDVHVFNTVSLRWIKLPPVATGREYPIEVPSKRSGHTAVLVGDIIYIWGGYTYTREDNGLYAFEVDTHRWFQPMVSGNIPGAREGHAACVLGRAMYIFGGFNYNSRYTNDIHMLDTTRMVWSLIETKGIPAHASLCHSATIIETTVFVFGGRGAETGAGQLDYNNDINMFDTETNRWLSPQPDTVYRMPERRACHSAFAYNGELYIFGGHNCILDRTFNDLWKFNPETFSWRKLEPKGEVPCLWMSRMCCCMVGDRIIFFGGYRYTSAPVDADDLEEDDEVSDLYIIDLSPSLKTLCKLAVIHHGLERSDLPQSVRWELDAMSTSLKKNIVHFQT